MKSNYLVLFTFICYLTNTFAYHDPDLNYHVNQLQHLQNCGNDGYHYSAPAIQLTTSGIKVAAPSIVNQHVALSAPGYINSKSSGYSSNLGYQTSIANNYYTQSFHPVQTAQSLQPVQPVAAYTKSTIQSSPQSVYSTQNSQSEGHGYATSAGLSTYTNRRTVTPLATYAQAPIIAKITAAPLIAKYAPAVKSYTNQNQILSLNSEGAAYNPVVSQVIVAPSAGYATSPALRVQGSSVNTQAAKIATSAVSNQAIAQMASTIPQYSTQYTTHSNAQFAAPIAQQYSPVFSQIFIPSIHRQPQNSIAAQTTAQYSSSIAHGVTNTAQYSSPPVIQVTSPTVSHIAPPPPLRLVSPTITKNVHTDFLENYDAHPRYAYEYRVHDPRTGDIKQQHEQRDGEVVKGQYSLVEPDGSVRTVNYFADWETGFHANVYNSKQNH